ncbi:hypothetical protein BGZ73_002836 [Actinomortierella ambigua]|nr:hypothetical protein BGZ73_002836 [Actinomortierella ambigua]
MGVACCKEEAIDFNGEIELSHFHLLRSVGKGAFGKVRVVQHKKTKEIYALKYINKAKCIRMRAVENIIQERRLLEEVEFPLICNLRYAFQDDENLFMVLDLMLGGDLRFHLERAGPMREDVVRFYVAELALALDALHARRIVHRDLKPDNVLLDEHGHAHLTDFNIAVYFHPSKPLVSIAGSMAYMAPEVLLRKGYFESVDWWSLGVVMFELLFGKRPFRGKSNDLLTNSILRDPLPLPENVNELASPECQDVLFKLCERDISRRLGCTPDGIDAFKKHPWFKDIDWDKLVTKEATPPFEPDSKRANFDATHELEELLMEDNPLKAKKRAQTGPETELSAEMQMMEDKFIVYDFTKVRRSHSLCRGRILKSDTKMSSGTLDGAIARVSTRIDSKPMMPPPKAYIPRPSSPSDRVGQDRFNPNEDQMPATPESSSPQSSPTSETPTARPPQISDELDIGIPTAGLPRPLQPRDQLTGVRAGSPMQFTQSTMPSSPSNSSGHSTLSTPPTTIHSSPATAKPTGGGTVLFASMDSGTSLSSAVNFAGGGGNSAAGAPLMDSANIPTTAGTTTRRAVRGRESSLGQSVSSMPPGGISTPVSSTHLPHHQVLSNGRGYPPRTRTYELGSQPQPRPMSAYTSSNAGSIQEDPLHMQQDAKTMHQIGAGGGFGQPYRASMIDMDHLSGLQGNGSLGIVGLDSTGQHYNRSLDQSDEKTLYSYGSNR